MDGRIPRTTDWRTHRHCALQQVPLCFRPQGPPGKLLRLRTQSTLSALLPSLFVWVPLSAWVTSNGSQGWGRASHFGTSTPSTRRHVPPCGLWGHGRWLEEHSVLGSSDIEAAITEPAEPESVQKQSLALCPLPSNPNFAIIPPPFQWDLAQSSTRWVMPDSKILSLVLRPVSSQPLTVCPLWHQLQMPGKFSFLCVRTRASLTQRGLRWGASGSQFSLLLGQLFSRPSPCVLLCLQGRVGREKRPAGGRLCHWHCCRRRLGQMGHCCVPGLSRRSSRHRFSGSHFKARPSFCLQQWREGPRPLRLPPLSLEALLVWVLFRETPSPPGGPSFLGGRLFSARRKGRRSCFLLAHSISWWENMLPPIFSRMGDAWFFCSLRP